MKYLITGGKNRVTTVTLSTSEKNITSRIEHLTSLNNPDLQWAVFEPVEINPILSDLNKDCNAFRLRNGTLELRPTAGIKMGPGPFGVGGSAFVDVVYSAEDAPTKLVEVNGQVVNAPFLFEFDEPGVYHFVPVSPAHYCYYTTIEIL